MKKIIAVFFVVLFVIPTTALAEKLIFVTDGQSPPFSSAGCFIR